MDTTGNSPTTDAAQFVRALAERHFRVRRGELHVEDVAVSQLAGRYGTPFFVYSESVIEAACESLRLCLPDGMGFYYSVKANPTQAILRQMLAWCDGLEIASAGELAQARAAGCSPGRIIFAGPAKTDAELHLALEAGVGELHVESLGEVERLARIAAEMHRFAGISVRVNPSAAVQGGSMRMGGRPTAFGIDEEQLPAVLARVLAEPWLELRGLHVYAGTQILDHNVLLLQYRHALDIARRIVDATGITLRTIDFGGGWGVPLFPHESPLDLASLHTGLVELLAEIRNDERLATARPVIEPGRFLVASSGIYVARVIDIKTSHGTKFVLLDGGMNHHLAASGNLGQTIKRNFPIAALNRMDEPLGEPVELVGPLCTPLDTLGRKVSLPDVAVGDLIGILQAGAYARSASPTAFLSHPAPPEVWVSGSEHRLVRRRGGVEDLLSDQSVAESPARETCRRA